MQQAQILQNLRQTGIEFLKDIPWGTHICGFYQTKKDLFDILPAYFESGLKNNEYCMWVISEPITISEAKLALKTSIPNFDLFYKLGQLEIINHSEWYLKFGNFDGKRVLDGWLEKVESALTSGYEGIRICGNTTWLKRRYFRTFMDYESEVEKQIGSLKMIALCTYKLDQCNFHEVIDIVNNHQFSFIKTQDDLESLYNVSKYDRINLVGKMAASIAHEVRNPMTTVRGYLQLLGGRKENAPLKPTFDLMISELDRANSIITEFLTLSGTKSSTLERQNLNEVLNKLYPLLEADAFIHNNQIRLKVGEIPEIQLNMKEISQLVLNLCRNGLEAMNEPAGCLTIQTYTKNKQVVLSVQDEGCGIPPEEMDNLGVPFHTTKEEGSGLGLAACYSIAASHNARIKVESSSSGTTFSIQFPIPDEVSKG
jgi:Signal transduction histidine kinase